MVTKLLSINFIILVLLFMIGCKPSGQTDLVIFKKITFQEEGERIIKRIFLPLEEENIYPYKLKPGCIIKKISVNQIFVCFEKNEFFIGGALNSGKIETNRKEFFDFVNSLESELKKKNILYEREVKKNISKTEFQNLGLYTK